MNLSTFVQKAMMIADKRNLAKENPITLTVPDVNGERYIYVVSYLEPNHATLPLNVVWIVADENSENFGKVYRRTSALPQDDLRNSWSEVVLYEEIFNEPQFYDRSGSFSLGEVQSQATKPATVLTKGIFKLNAEPEDPENPIVISSNDPRMSDARIPKSHNHPNLPKTMILGSKGVNDFFVRVENSKSPVAGQILMITGQSRDDEKEYIGIWRNPVRADIEYDGPSFDSLTVIGPSQIDENETEGFIAKANFSDGTDIQVQAMWSVISGGEYANISALTGKLTTQDVDSDVPIRIQAEWTHPESGVKQTKVFDIEIIDTTVYKTLKQISIIGPYEVGENTQASYTIEAKYTDGSTANVAPTEFNSSNGKAGSFDASTGILSTPNLTQNENTTLSAKYSERGVTKSASMPVTVKDLTVYPVSASISGPSEVGENSLVRYKLNVVFSDSSNRVVNVTSWKSSNIEAGAISVLGDFQAPVELKSNKETVITASYTSEGRTVDATKTIVVQDTTNYPVSLVIEGADTIDEETTENYTLKVTYKDNTTKTVSGKTWSTDTPYANAANGELTAVTVTQDVNFTLYASYEEHGKTVLADKAIKLIDTTNYPLSAIIVGNGVMQEGSTQALSFRVSYKDGTTKEVNPEWSYVGSISLSGSSVTAKQVTSDDMAYISASYSEHGVDLTDTLDIVVKDTTIYPESAVIVGLNTVSENTTVFYSLEVTFDDGSIQTVKADSWSVDNADAGSITAVGEFTASERKENVSAKLTANYSVDGRSVTATKNITVIDKTIYPSQARIVGPDVVDENSTNKYYLEVTYTNSSKKNVSPTWSIDNTNLASINAGELITNGVVNNQSLTLTATYSEEGVDFTENKTVSITDTTLYPTSLEINGPASVKENETIDLTTVVTYTDNSTAVVNPEYTIPSGTGTITGNTYKAPANVTKDTDIVVSASYMENGVTKTTNKTITVTDETVYPESAEILAPDNISENTTTSMRFRVTYPNSTTATVVPTWSVSSPIASVNNNGVLTVGEANADETITVSGTYVLDGKETTATKDILVVDETAYPRAYRIEGPDTFDENGTYPLRFITSFTDDTEREETASWSLNVPSEVATIENGFLSIGDIDSDINATVTATAVVNDVEQTLTKEITFVDLTDYPESILVEGPSSIAEGQTVYYTGTVLYSSGQVYIPETLEWTSDNVNLTISSTGETVLGDITYDQTATITASFTSEGRTVTDSILINLTMVPRTPVSVFINGVDTITEKTSERFSATVVYDDASEDIYTNKGTWTVDAGSVADGLVTSPETSENETIILTYSHTENGTTVSATKSITVTDIFPTSLTVTGPDTLLENGEPEQYSAGITNSDFSSENVTASVNWYSSDETTATVVAGMVSPASNIVGSSYVTITAEYVYNDSLTLSESKTILVNENIARPTGVEISGNLTLSEGDTTTLVATLTYDDTTTENVTNAGTWTSSDETLATVSNGTVRTYDVTENKSVNIIFDYTSTNGETYSVTKTLNITDAYRKPSYILVSGNNVVDVNDTTDLTATVHYDDGTTADVTSSATWTSSDPAVATVSNGTVSGVSENTVTITVDYMENSLSVSRDYTMTVDAQSLPLPRSGYYPYVNLVDQPPEEVLTETLINEMFTKTSDSTDNGVQFLGAGGDGIDTFGWFMHPAELGEVSKYDFVEVGPNWLGAWEGVYAPNKDAAPYYDFTPPRSGLRFTYQGRDWYIYRSDFPIVDLTYSVVKFPNNS